MTWKEFRKGFIIFQTREERKRRYREMRKLVCQELRIMGTAILDVWFPKNPKTGHRFEGDL